MAGAIPAERVRAEQIGGQGDKQGNAVAEEKSSAAVGIQVDDIRDEDGVFDRGTKFRGVGFSIDKKEESKSKR
jgi:hypothetical protein